MFTYVDVNNLKSVNESKLLLGISIILLNIGSKYIEMGLTKTQEEALRNGIAREILLFSMIFIATRDIIISILMTASFVILADHILNDTSSMCIIPGYYKKIKAMIDTNGDGKVSAGELAAAIKKLSR
jgi:hypothetical protein